MAGTIYGYIRVSTREQNEDRQRLALAALPVPKENIYMDKQSGKDFERPQYRRLVRRLRRDDLLYVKSIDRLGRNYSEILEQWRMLTKEKGVDIAVLDMPLLDTREKADNLIGRFISDIVLQILSFVSENERVNIKTRQAEGIRLAKQKGVRFGRPRVERPGNFDEIAALYDTFQIDFQEALRQSNLRHTTFYNFLREYRVARSAGALDH